MTPVVPGADEVLDHLNGNHADTVLFIARHAASDPTLVDAELFLRAADGVTLEGRNDAGEQHIHLPAPSPIETTADLQLLLFSHIMEARADAPDGELTSIERELAAQDSIPLRVVDVVAVDDIADGLRQITFGGVRGHVPIGPEDFFLVIRPDDLSELDGNVSFDDLKNRPPEDQPAWAYYTVRRSRPERGELDFWFVLHEHDGAISGWARHASPGDRVALWGPRDAFEPPDGTSSLLLVGDETGLGAFAAILEAYADGIPVTAVVVSDHGTPVIELPAQAKDQVIHVGRDGAVRGTGTALLDTVRGLDLDAAGVYAYGAAESREITQVRKHLRKERLIPGTQVQMLGYWRSSDETDE